MFPSFGGQLRLDDNPCVGDDGAVALAATLKASATLARVSVRRCGVGQKGGAALLACGAAKPGLLIRAAAGNDLGQSLRRKFEDRERDSDYDAPDSLPSPSSSSSPPLLSSAAAPVVQSAVAASSQQCAAAGVGKPRRRLVQAAVEPRPGCPLAPRRARLHIVGDVGSGKTALAQSLTRRCAPFLFVNIAENNDKFFFFFSSFVIRQCPPQLLLIRSHQHPPKLDRGFDGPRGACA